jgi:hypothetical protein
VEALGWKSEIQLLLFMYKKSVNYKFMYLLSWTGKSFVGVVLVINTKFRTSNKDILTKLWDFVMIINLETKTRMSKYLKSHKRSLQEPKNF